MNNNRNTSIRKQTYSTSTIVIIVSLLLLVFICVYLYNSYKEYKKKIFATNMQIAYTVCPDYWDTISNGKCQNTNRLGKCSKVPGANIMDFSGEIFTNKNTGDYAKCKWAKSCNVAWGNIDRLC